MIGDILAVLRAYVIYDQIARPLLDNDQAELERIMRELEEEEARRSVQPPSLAWPVCRELLLAATHVAIYCAFRWWLDA